jgi:hypothetical protein
MRTPALPDVDQRISDFAHTISFVRESIRIDFACNLSWRTRLNSFGIAIANRASGGLDMKSNNLRNKIGRILLALGFLVSVGLASSIAVQAQWPQDRDQDRRNRDRDRRDRDRDYRRDQNRDYRRNDQYGRNGGYGNINQVAVNQGFQDGLYTGSSDAQRGQNYNPQRSHFYRNGHGNNGGYGNYGNNYQYQQAYRNGFLQGYNQGYQRYGGYNNNRRNNGNYGRFPFPW